ncbi:unnamed protein product [Ostreobium quekettii]|uniref:Uncharacterized protein n=1 Tax=Ostreobium quekettii TaxID=121088 RepID=A0A8S1J6I9_9CHLO|nr:unnamed protein product [Ostreobium quekettii]
MGGEPRKFAPCPAASLSRKAVESRQLSRRDAFVAMALVGVWLNGDAVLASRYYSHKPVLPQYYLSRPYAKRPAGTAEPSSDQDSRLPQADARSLEFFAEEPDCNPIPKRPGCSAGCEDAQSHAEISAGSSKAGAAEGRAAQALKTKKRKRVSKKQYMPNSREQEANCRHEKLKPVLERAWQIFFAEMREEIGARGLGSVESRWLCGSPGSLGDQDGMQVVSARHGFTLGKECLPTSTQRKVAMTRSVTGESIGQDGYSVKQKNVQQAVTRHESGHKQNVEKGAGGHKIQRGLEAWELGKEFATQENWVLLGSMKSIIKPKLWIGNRPSIGASVTSIAVGATGETASPQDLFDTIHEAAGDGDTECVAHNARVVLPARSRFLMSDIKQVGKIIPENAKDLDDAEFDVIVIDPPWENRSASRKQAYQLLPCNRLLGLPVGNLARKGGAIVALWTTNRERLLRFVEDRLLQQWGLRTLARWFWLKVAATGELAAPLECNHRRPYEQIIIATNSPEGAFSCHLLPDNFVVVCMPSSHSRKPPIAELLQQFLGPHLRCLEMFARELVPGWTSWGNEVLHFQTFDWFE